MYMENVLYPTNSDSAEYGAQRDNSQATMIYVQCAKSGVRPLKCTRDPRKLVIFSCTEWSLVSNLL